MAVRRRVVARCERRTLHAGGGGAGSGPGPWDAGSGLACPGSWRMGSCTKDALRLRPASWLCWLVKKHCAAPGSSGAAPGAVCPQRLPCSAAPCASLGMPERVAPDPASAGNCCACAYSLLLEHDQDEHIQAKASGISVTKVFTSQTRTCVLPCAMQRACPKALGHTNAAHHLTRTRLHAGCPCRGRSGRCLTSAGHLRNRKRDNVGLSVLIKQKSLVKTAITHHLLCPLTGRPGGPSRG